MTSPGKSHAESGFALLFIYAMAAVFAIMLFLQLPRVAFEAQRDREQLLIDRGEQYSRAVTLFVRKFNRYPPDLDALNNTQNMRFLRNKYVDPMTGKDEWRLIHVGPGGVFTDSLIYNKKKDDQASGPQNFITELQQTGGNQSDPSQAGVNIGTRTRPSDAPGAPGDPNNPQVAPPPQELPPGVPQAGLPVPSQPGAVQPGLIQPGLPQFDANGQPIPNTGTPQTQFPQPGVPGLPPGVQLPPGMPLPPGMNLPGGQTQTPMQSTSGVGLINQILTQPRPGGPPPGIGGQMTTGGPTVDQYGNPIAATNPLTGNVNAAPGAAAAPAQAAMGQVIGGGVAGVASKRELEGIKIYKDRKKYNEWEFVYDVTKDKSRNGAAGAVPAAAAAPGTPIGGTSPFGAQQPQPQQTQQPATPTGLPTQPPTQ